MESHLMYPPLQPLRQPTQSSRSTMVPSTSRVPSSSIATHPYLRPPPSSQRSPSSGGTTPIPRPTSSQSARGSATPARPTAVLGPGRMRSASVSRSMHTNNHFIAPPSSQPAPRSAPTPPPFSTQTTRRTMREASVLSDAIPQTQSPADLMMGGFETRAPLAKRLLDTSTGLVEKITGIEGVLTTISNDQKSVRDQVHKLQTAIKALPSKDDLMEDINAQMPALLENAIQPILDKLESSAPASTAELENHITHAFHTELLRAQNAIIKAIQTQTPPSASSPPRSSPSIEQPIMALMTHLINSLKPVQDLTSCIRVLKDVEIVLPTLEKTIPALEEVIAWNEVVQIIKGQEKAVPTVDKIPASPVNPVEAGGAADTSVNAPYAHDHVSSDIRTEMKRMNEKVDGFQATLEAILTKLGQMNPASLQVTQEHQVQPTEDPNTTPTRAAASTRSFMPTPVSNPIAAASTHHQRSQDAYQSGSESPPDQGELPMYGFDGDVRSASESPSELVDFDVFGDVHTIPTVLSNHAQAQRSAAGAIAAPEPLIQTTNGIRKGRPPKRKASNPKPASQQAQKKAKTHFPPPNYVGPVTRSLSREQDENTQAAPGQEAAVISVDNGPVLQVPNQITPSQVGESQFVDPPSARTRNNAKPQDQQSTSQSQTPTYNTKKKPRSEARPVKPPQEQTGITTSDSSSDDSRASDFGAEQHKKKSFAAKKGKKILIPAASAALSKFVAQAPVPTNQATSLEGALDTGCEDIFETAKALAAVPSGNFTFSSPMNSLKTTPAQQLRDSNLDSRGRLATFSNKGKSTASSNTATQAPPHQGIHRPTPIRAPVGRSYSSFPQSQSQAGPSRFGSGMSDTLKTQNSAGGQAIFPTASTISFDSFASETYESFVDPSQAHRPGSSPGLSFGRTQTYGGTRARVPTMYGSAASRRGISSKLLLDIPVGSSDSED